MKNYFSTKIKIDNLNNKICINFNYKTKSLLFNSLRYKMSDQVQKNNDIKKALLKENNMLEDSS
jgi:hypothetical protein